MMKNKLKLKDLKVNSFVTKLGEQNVQELKGGTGHAITNDGLLVCLQTEFNADCGQLSIELGC